MRILVVDDNQLFAEAVQMVLEQDGHEVTSASTGAEARSACSTMVPDVLLVDIGLPDADGLQLGRELLSEHEGVRVVVLTCLASERTLQDAIRSGFHGYLTKDTRLSEFVGSVREAANGGMVLPQRLAMLRRDRPGRGGDLLTAQLTPREREVIVLLSEGAGSGDIASALQISPNTVRTHIQSILSKLQVHSRLEAIAFAARHGLLGERARPAVVG